MSGAGKLGIWGWWQGQNLGDNWIRHILAGQFPGAEFIPSSKTDFSDYAFVICGGGGLFIRNVCRGWEPPLRVPYGMLGLGAEFAHTDGLAPTLKDGAAFFYVRDKYSLDCMKIYDAVPSFDTTFIDPLPQVPDVSPKQDTVFMIWREPGILLEYEDFREYIGPTAPLEAWNAALGKAYRTIAEQSFHTSSWEVDAQMNEASLVVSGRFHGVLAAIQKGIPCIGIDICPKIRALMHDVGLEKYCLKIGQVDQIDVLLSEIQRDFEQIRALEREYTHKAHKAMVKTVEDARNIIKAFVPMNGCDTK